ncbi:T9SS type B sorting domain-containing protein [Winogradskyella thalassocola]|uniref:Gliding motility-associated C-terminal domain-containing protein n=1 Tax=Winogradskyella thalassocola TaxID=262004 RepID=A0A1G8EWM6_9FLAO|nr:T9SS type B sorting domain-containing protein [Winogradskyella thalassocola]SDH74217.1 gliding motility-associated C-terminal domain-containing protein [Winogradskyella thalassocola]
MRPNLIFFLVITLFGINCSYSQQITTDDSLLLEQLIQQNLGQNCVEISNISSSINGSINGINSYGYFDRADSSFPFENGILLTTGDVNSAGNILNSNPLNEGDDTWLTDLDLENALGITNTQNATSIQFNFISVANQIQFNYLLASEEYQQEFPCFYSDGFAFLIREAGSSAPYSNIALVPGTSTPVNTNTIHDQIEGFCAAENEAFFEGYNVGDTNYNGRTTVLTATAAIQPNVEYQIKLIIADQTDNNFDSAVFIEGNSFNANVDLGPNITTCGDSVTINGDIQNPQASYNWYKNDVLITGENNATLNVLSSGTYKVEITIQLNATSCVIEDTIEITLDSEQSSTQISDIVYCDDDSNDGVENFDLSTKDIEVLASVPPSNYNISYHYSSEDAENNSSPITGTIQNTSSPQPIFVRIEDTVNGCLAFSTFNLIVNEKPEYEDPDPIVACKDATLDGFTFVDLNVANDQITNGNPNLYVSYHFSEPEADLGQNPIFSPYANLNTSQTLYVRIYDALTGCFSTTTLSVQMQDSPATNTEDQWINACEEDDDGFEDFDLTSIIDDVLQGITGLDVSFHVTEFDAHNNLNPIADPEDYQNTTEGFQLLYIRVEDPTTGCYTITKLGLYANIIKTNFSGQVFIVCDDISNDGIADFDLNDVEIELIDGYDEFEVQFFLTEDDRTNNTNELDKNIPFNVINNVTTIYATLVDGECIGYVDVVLQISPAVILTPQSVDYCDEDDDGFTTLIMDTFNSVALQGVQAGNVKYYLTEDDAINNENILPDYHYNTANPQLFYIRVINFQTECYDISTLEVNVVSAPSILYPESIIICDDNDDGISVVNLESKIPEIVPSTVGVEISFYNNYNDAIEGDNVILDPQNYSTATQYIYARVENETTGCYSLSGFYIYVNTLPEFISITNFENCEADITGVADFYFYLKDDEILNGQPDKQVLYYETEADALAGINVIDKYSIYNNTSSPQTIYVRVESFTDSDCYGTSSFDIEVGSIPIFNAAENIFVCDDISNDGFITIDLNDKIAEMIAGSPETLDISFHVSAIDAMNNSNPVPLNYTNSTNPQELYARVDNGNYCKGISAFDINVISAPIVNSSTPIARCDDNYDGILTWDLTVSEIEILGVRQDNIEVTYFETLDDLEANINAIPDPENYNNISNPQTAFVKINNTLSNCFVNVPLELIVNLPPPFNDFEVYEICDNPTTSFDLSEIESVLINPGIAATLTYYETFNNAENSINPLDLDYNYQTVNDVIFVRIEHPDTGCFFVYDFILQVNPSPIANTPNDIEACDDDSNDGIASFNLESQTGIILGTQNPDDFTVTYHLNLTDAETGDNLISSPHTTTNQQVIVRIENNDTGCYSITDFNLIVNPHPNIPNPLLECDTNYDASTPFNLTTAEDELFTTPNPDNIISYFTSLDDLQVDNNPILNPTNYYNTSNPQTIFIKVYNTVADCFTFVPLELNVNLPPATNTFEIFDTCENDINSFDLTTINDVIVDTNYNVLFSYFSSEADAIANQNALDTNYTYLSTNDIIFARIEFSTTHCYYIHPFELRVNPLPIANQPPNLTVCDDDFDGYFDFNLNQQTATILGFQNPSNYSVAYFNNILDALEGINPLNADSYNGNTNEIITARIENNTTGCYSLVDFSLIVNRKPYVNIPNQVVCIDNLPLVVSANTFYESDTFLWSNNQIGSEIEITDVGTYSVTVTSEHGCTTTSTFNVTASESATIDLTETVDFSDPNNITITISGIGNYLYILDDNDPQESNVFENVALGYHTVTIIDLNGCAEVTKEVVVVDAPPFFTPNGDTQNDTWHIIGIETLPGSIVYVFNRYGKLIKQLSSSTQGWDGTYNGYNMPATDYWFLAEIKQGNIAFEVRGHFALRR